MGNPGRTYARNRHNIGFMCLNHFAKSHAIPFDRKQGQARIGTGIVNGIKVVVARPQTFMNQSGQSVALLVRKFKVELSNLIVVHDDLDLPVGKIRIRRGVGWTGHKGVRSVATGLGSGDFSLLRVGIGRPSTIEGTTEADIIDYVLGDFTPDEEQVITQVIPRVSDAILCLLAEGLTAAMNKYN